MIAVTSEFDDSFEIYKIENWLNVFQEDQTLDMRKNGNARVGALPQTVTQQGQTLNPWIVVVEEGFAKNGLLKEIWQRLQNAEKPSTHSAEASLHRIPLNGSQKKSVEGFNGSKTTLAHKNTVMQSTGFKGAIGSSRSHNKRIQTSYTPSKKIKKLQEYVGDLGKNRIRENPKFQEDQCGLSCDEKMFLRMYPIPMSDPLVYTIS
ncbi:hypothetical protein B9Z55_027989 [Caenorhabditis nigoni]|uniref:Uncharacterized protein n=1 Tax=Caenorhabditis nigoni TaxID=1611254 RepID=A0A2G5SDW8_9PELO|nr:hypothetical protein B9Z55_027989 [Caenorhabditis nigoni]